MAESAAAAVDVASLPAAQGIPDKLRRAPPPVVAPLPASPAAWRAGSELLSAARGDGGGGDGGGGDGGGKGSRGASECQGDAEWGEACSVATIAFWGPLDTANGLVEFCDAVTAVLDEASRGQGLFRSCSFIRCVVQSCSSISLDSMRRRRTRGAVHTHTVHRRWT